MYLQFKGKILASILDDLRSVIERRRTITALSHVLIESTTAGRARFTATDLDHTLQIEAAHEGLFTGSLCAPLDKLLGLAKAFKEEDLTLEPQKDGWSELRTERGKYRLAGVTTDSYPQLPTVEAQSYEVEASDLLLALSEVALHAGPEDVKYSCRHTLLELNGSLRCVAVSGRSMGVCEVRPDQPFLQGGVARWLIPFKAVTAVRSAFKSTGKILVWADDNHLCFRQGDRLLTSRRPEAEFPNFEPVFDILPKEEVTVDREGLARVLEALTIFAPTETGHVTDTYKSAQFEFDCDGLTVKATSHESEEAAEEVDAKAPEEFQAKLEVFMLRSMLKQAGEGARLYAAGGKPWAVIAETERHKTTQVLNTLAR